MPLQATARRKEIVDIGLYGPKAGINDYALALIITRSQKGLNMNIKEIIRLDNEYFIDGVYKFVLGREPDLIGLAHYTNKLNSKIPKILILLDVLTSKEAASKVNTTNAIDCKHLLAKYRIYKILPYKEAFIRTLFNEYIIDDELSAKYDWGKFLENKIEQRIKTKTVALSVTNKNKSMINELILSSGKGKSYQERARYHFRNGDRKGALKILNTALTEDENSLIDFDSLEQLIDAGETLDAYRITTAWLTNKDFYGNYKLVKIAATLAIQLEKNKEGIHLLRRLINLERDNMVNDNPEKRLRIQDIFQNIFFCYWDMANLKEAHKVLTEMELAGCHCSAFVLEWKSCISLEVMNFRSCLKHAYEYMRAFPEYSQTAYGLIQKGLLSQRKFIELKSFIAEKRIPLALDLFDEGLTETDLCSFANSSLNRKPCHIFDLTSLTIALESGASFGGIERTLVELTYNIINSRAKDVVFITWKNMIPVIVRPIDFMASIFSERAASDEPNTINTSKLTKFDTLYSPLPGDIIVIAGSVWHYDPNCDKHKYFTNYGASPIYLVYDLLQIFFPQLVSEKWSARFEGWVSRVIKLSSIILVDSKYASREIQQYSHLNNIDISSKELVEIELGDNFMPMALSRKYKNLNTNTIITDRPYVLYVSSISARKNHPFLVNAWSRLESKIGDQCPELKIVGSKGDGTKALDDVLITTNFANGKVSVLTSVDDNGLITLYDSCLFCVFPSICEGWGLPIAEALSYGKVCLASNATSMPEAGGSLADYFDHYDEDEFLSLVLKYLDEDERTFREGEIKQAYKRRDWSATLKQIFHATARINKNTTPLEFKEIEVCGGVVIVCASLGQNCGIASYSLYVVNAIRETGRECVIVDDSSSLFALLNTGKFLHVIVQHEYGLYDGLIPHLGQGEATGTLIKNLSYCKSTYSDIKISFVMHTIDSSNPLLVQRNNIIFNSDIDVYTLNSNGARKFNLNYLEHGIPNGHEFQNFPEKISSSQKKTTIGWFGFVSSMKRIDKLLIDIARLNCEIFANFATEEQSVIDDIRSQISILGLKGTVTFGFASDRAILDMLARCDFCYFPQADIGYHATSGSVRLAMLSETPVLVSPHEQFLDLARGVIFVEDEDLEACIEKLRGRAVYNATVKRQSAFVRSNTIELVYNNMLSGKKFSPVLNKLICVRQLLMLPNDVFIQIISHLVSNELSCISSGGAEDDELLTRIKILKEVFCKEHGITGDNNSVYFLYMGDPLPSLECLSVDQIYLSDLFALVDGYISIHLYRSMAGRNPTLDEHKAVHRLWSLDPLACVYSLAQALHYKGTICDNRSLELLDKANKICNLQRATSDVGITGDNLAAYERTRLRKEFPDFLLP